MKSYPSSNAGGEKSKINIACDCEEMTGTRDFELHNRASLSKQASKVLYSY